MEMNITITRRDLLIANIQHLTRSMPFYYVAGCLMIIVLCLQLYYRAFELSIAGFIGALVWSGLGVAFGLLLLVVLLALAKQLPDFSQGSIGKKNCL